MSGHPVSSVVIDGYNLIHRVPELARRVTGEGGLYAARSYLLGWLRRYQAARHRRVVLVLDGPSGGRSDFGPVEVIYCPSADDGVARLAAPGTMVVTSDAAVATAARLSGADVISSEDFWMRVTSGAGAASPRPAAAGQAAARRSRVGTTGQGGRGYGFDKDSSDDEDEGLGAAQAGSKKGNPKPRSKAARRRAQAHADLLRKV